MKLSFRRSLACGALCAAAVLARLPAVADDKAPAAKDAPAKDAAAVAADEAFGQYVDLRLLGVAWQTLDAKLMTDAALQLRHGEKELGHKHSQFDSESLLSLCQTMAVDGKDAETLMRLARVAAADGKQDRQQELEQLASLTSNSRDLRDEAMFSAKDVQRGALAAFANILLQIRAAQVSGDGETLQHLKKAVDLLESLVPSLKERLQKQITEAETSLAQANPSVEALQMLTGPSRRDYTGVIIDPAGPGSPVVGAAVIVDPVAPTPVEQFAYACGGMRYFATPSGAIVQSIGRLGSILFEPGDVIMQIGGVPISQFSTVDAAVNTGYLTGNRSVSVRDRNSGRVLFLYY